MGGCWVVDEKSGQTQPTQYAVSRDGRTFGAPQPTGFHAQTAKLIALRDGRILCLYRRHDQPGLWGALATLEGDHWRTHEQAPLWQGTCSGMAGERSTGESVSESLSEE